MTKQRRVRRFRIFAGIGIVLLLALGIAGLKLGWWVKKDTADLQNGVGSVKLDTSAIREKTDTIAQDTARTREAADTTKKAVLEAIPRLTELAAAAGGKGGVTRRTLLFPELEKKHGLPAGTLEKELPDIARKRAEDAAVPKIERAKAAKAALDYTDAERLALEAYADVKKGVPLDKHKLIEALELAGTSATARRDDKAALTHLTAASKLTDKAADPLEWARVHHALADALFDHGEAARAAALLPEVIAIREDKLRAEHADTLASRSKLVATLWAQGKNAEAEAGVRAVLAIRERVLGAEHPDTLESRSNLAVVLQAQGKHAEAEAEHRAALGIEERVLGGEHPHTLTNRNNLAEALRAQKKNAEAEAEHRAVLAIRERVLGAEYPDTLNSRNNLANTLGAQGKIAEAEAEHRAVLAIGERVLGAKHPDVALSCYNLALCLDDQGRKQEALDFARRAFEMLRKAIGAEHRDTKAAQALVTRLTGEGKGGGK